MSFKIAHFTNIAPHYREALWYQMLFEDQYQFHFYFGKSSVKGIRCIDFNQKKWAEVINQLHSVSNFTLFGRLIFQFGVINKVLLNKWDAVILLGDSNVLSNWISVIILKLKGTPILFWGHGLYGNESGVKKWLRIQYLKFADVNLVYGKWAKRQMAKEGFDPNKIQIIYNSLDYKKSLELRAKVIDQDYYKKEQIFNNNLPVLIFVGRLTPQKNIDWFIDSVKSLTEDGVKLNALIVGDGIERESLEKRAERLENVHFFGACYDEDMLAKLIANADLCVSPGNVGLTAIHSLSYGTPVCTHNNFTRQMPEFEAIQEDKTGCFFDWKKKDVKKTIEKWLSKENDREEIRKNCYEVIDTFYNPENQVAILKESINDLIL